MRTVRLRGRKPRASSSRAARGFTSGASISTRPGRPAQSSPASPQAARQAAGSGRRATAVAEPIAEPVAAWEDWANDNLEDW
jgi:hypothetical protein